MKRRLVTVILGLICVLCAARVHAADSKKPDQTLKDLNGKVEDLRQQVDSLSDQVEEVKPGTIKFLLAGTYAGDFAFDNKSGATGLLLFRPHFYFLFGKRFFWEGDVDFRLKVRDKILNEIFGEEESTSSVALIFGDFYWIANDYLTVSAGQFLDPISFFEERLHTNWVFKTPQKPLANNPESGIVPDSQLGLQFRGVIPVGASGKKLDYNVWIGNGPTLDDGRLDSKNTGRLRWDNFLDFRNSLAAGAQVGFFPIPTLEFGGAFLWSRVDASQAGFAGVRAQLADAYLTYTPSVPAIGGNLNLYIESLLSHVTRVDFASGSFRNTRLGTYAQLSYRPTMAKKKFFKNIEFVGRYDRLDIPSGAPQPSTQQATAGINYLFQPNIIWKNSYVMTMTKGEGRSHAYLSQLAIGF